MRTATLGCSIQEAKCFVGFNTVTEGFVYRPEGPSASEVSPNCIQNFLPLPQSYKTSKHGNNKLQPRSRV